MTNQDRQSKAFPRWDQAGQSRRRVNLAAAHRGERWSGWGDSRYLLAYRILLARYRRLIRIVAMVSGALAGFLILAGLGLWWRLSNGPIQVDAFTPWLVAAIEENFGSHAKVEVGGTQIERTSTGAAVRVRDIVVRDSDGTIVASAPKAEIHVSGMSLFSGHPRAESLNLVGAEVAMRIETNGDISVFASGAKHPIATVPAAAAALVDRPAVSIKQDKAGPIAVPSTSPAASAQALPRPPTDSIAALLSWIDGIGETGLDGHDLRELGLKDGNLTVDDQRTGKRWTFNNITLSLERPHGGGVVVTVGSETSDKANSDKADSEKPWGLTAAIKPLHDGTRSVQLEARQVAADDLLLAARFGDGNMQVNLPLSASLRGEIGENGIPQSLTGRVVAEAGSISDATDSDGRIDIDHAEFKINWDAASHILAVPFQIVSGSNRLTLLGQVEAPAHAPGPWQFKIGGGSVVLNSPNTSGDPLVLNRIAFAGQFDPWKKRFVLDQGDLGGTDVGVAMSGSADYSSGDLKLAAGIAANRMPADALRKLWPVFVAPKVRDWFNDHLSSGYLERLVVAVNAPLNTLKASGPPLPDDGLSVEALATNCILHPVAGLPPLHDVDLMVHIVGRDAQIAVGRATADMPSGKKLILSSGVFEVPDTAPQQPPARVRFKIDGPIPAAIELLSMDRLRDAAAVPFDPATTRGNMSAQVSLGMPLRPDLPPGSTTYTINVDTTNFSAEHMIMGQKVEAAALKVAANNDGFQLKGDVKIGGTPAQLDYRKAKSDQDADVHIQGMLDETMRNNLGLDLSNSIGGSIPIDISGKVGSGGDRDGRFAVVADLTPAQILGFMPGWEKQSGKPARATFTLTTKPQSIRIDDLLIEGAGGGVKGNIEFDGSGQLVSANFPSYGFADGDRASLKVDRTAEGAMKVVMRGDAYDGRGFVKNMTSSPPAEPGKKPPPDIDVDMKLGAVLGYNGEALRSLELKMSRRAGEVRSLGVTAKIGRAGALTGDLRSRADGHQVVDLESTDAGALFRFTDVYSRMNGGQITTVMDPPSVNNQVQYGSVSVRNFSVHDESQLERAVANDNQQLRGTNTIDFSELKVDFTRTPGQMALRDGVVRGPVLGGTIDGVLDYTRDDVHLRGTLIPLYGANNLLGQLPVVGLFLGGEKEGLVGVTYEVVGHPNQPVLHVNPLSALAPGLLRKIFEFPATSPFVRPIDPNAAAPADTATGNVNH
ncbi:MAG TPA: DUF3971 domain-containing protein [Xanthobacteraceae bacterium]|jgi:hypothetical protein|nr:DUF3971 domain-containing protein [Xanthobacteraceae bacterium]